MITFIHFLATITILTTIGFTIYVGAPWFIVILIILGLGGPLLCSLGALFAKGD